MNPLSRHVYTIHLHRHIYQEMATITEAAELPASYYFGFGSQTYATSQAVAIRRLADCDPRVISLGRLITEIAEDPRRFTRELYGGVEYTIPRSGTLASNVFGCIRGHNRRSPRPCHPKSRH